MGGIENEDEDERLKGREDKESQDSEGVEMLVWVYSFMSSKFQDHFSREIKGLLVMFGLHNSRSFGSLRNNTACDNSIEEDI